MIRGFFYNFNRSFENLENVIFHVKLLSPTLNHNIIALVHNCLKLVSCVVILLLGIQEKGNNAGELFSLL